MATIDLGKIKMVWRGAYDNATAYTPDDVVSSGGTSYICILASTGNAVTNTTYWNVLAQGGTDVGTTLTTEGDILYRDGSGLQRLAKPGSTMYLQMTSGGVPSWSALSSDFVKIASVDVSSAVGELAFNEQFSSTYKKYKLIFQKFRASANNNELRLRLRIGTTNQTANNEYYSTYHTSYYNGASGGVNNSNDKFDHCRVLNWSLPHTSGNRSFNGEINFYDPQEYRPVWAGLIHGHERNFDNILNATFAHTYDQDVNVDGFTLYLSGGANFIDGTATLYGIKE
tara:strand:+ start:1723 stop:2574 length:852 start_codon:yes stop_codon:yes gene_type:complete